MNSNTHNYKDNILYFYSPATLAPTYLLRNPTTEDFERLIRQYQQYFSIS